MAGFWLEVDGVALPWGWQEPRLLPLCCLCSPGSCSGSCRCFRLEMGAEVVRMVLWPCWGGEEERAG